MAVRTNFKKNVANFFGAIGYLFCSLQWLWAILLYFSLIKAFALFITPNINSRVVNPVGVTNTGFDTIPVVVVAVITFIMIVLTIYIIIKIPSIIVKTSKKIVHQTSESVTPAILKIQNKKDTKRNHIKLSSLLIIIIKTALIVIPIIMSFLSRLIEKQIIDFYIVMFISLWLAGLSLAFFVLQYLIARLLIVSRQDLW